MFVHMVPRIEGGRVGLGAVRASLAVGRREDRVGHEWRSDVPVNAPMRIRPD